MTDSEFLDDRDCEAKAKVPLVKKVKAPQAITAEECAYLSAHTASWQEFALAISNAVRNRIAEAEPVAWRLEIDGMSSVTNNRYQAQEVEKLGGTVTPLYTRLPAALPIDHPEKTGALGALNALFAENELPMSDRNGVLYDTIKNALAELLRNEALNNAMKITEELDRRREERLRRLRLHEAIGLELTDEQCDDVILRVGLWHLAEAESRNRATLRWLCREAVAAARGSK